MTDARKVQALTANRTCNKILPRALPPPPSILKPERELADVRPVDVMSRPKVHQLHWYIVGGVWLLPR